MIGISPQSSSISLQLILSLVPGVRQFQINLLQQGVTELLLTVYTHPGQYH